MFKHNSQNKMQFVVNQDRDKIFPLDVSNICTLPAICNETIYGINIMYTWDNETHLIGSFDSIEEAIAEINNILANDAEIIPIEGFSAGIYEEIRQRYEDSYDDMYEEDCDNV